MDCVITIVFIYLTVCGLFTLDEVEIYPLSSALTPFCHFLTFAPLSSYAEYLNILRCLDFHIIKNGTFIKDALFLYLFHSCESYSRNHLMLYSSAVNWRLTLYRVIEKCNMLTAGIEPRPFNLGVSILPMWPPSS